jgi:hypothetical protein
MQLGLSDHQLKQITAVAMALPIEKRGVLLQRVASYCRLNGYFRPSDAQIDLALHSALTGLQQHAPGSH